MEQEQTLRDELNALLRQLLNDELANIPRAVSKPVGDPESLLTDIPVGEMLDQLTLEDLASLVAQTSNAYIRASRLSGIAHAEYKIAKGVFDRKWKKSRIGGNAEERERNAMQACEAEHAALTSAEVLVELAEGLEHGARVASESIRKIFGSAHNMTIGASRESTGTYSDSDYTPHNVSTW